MRRYGWALVTALVVLGVLAWQGRLPELLDQVVPQHASTALQTSTRAAPSSTPPTSSAYSSRSALPAFLPAEAHRTLDLIARNGPFPNPQDGSVFGNRERQLPQRSRGYYREYTVATPGLRHRGARRLVVGGDPPEVYYYTDDHYRSFRQFEVPR